MEAKATNFNKASDLIKALYLKNQNFINLSTPRYFFIITVNLKIKIAVLFSEGIKYSTTAWGLVLKAYQIVIKTLSLFDKPEHARSISNFYCQKHYQVCRS